MRSKTTHAVWSGVGESAARESESAKCRHSGKSTWRVPNPQIWPRELRFSGPFLCPDFSAVNPPCAGSPSVMPGFQICPTFHPPPPGSGFS